jgi:hypothetical protein
MPADGRWDFTRVNLSSLLMNNIRDLSYYPSLLYTVQSINVVSVNNPCFVLKSYGKHNKFTADKIRRFKTLKEVRRNSLLLFI